MSWAVATDIGTWSSMESTIIAPNGDPENMNAVEVAVAPDGWVGIGGGVVRRWPDLQPDEMPQVIGSWAWWLGAENVELIDAPPLPVSEQTPPVELVAIPSRQQYANPWHDELGRFAPKGTGKKSGFDSTFTREHLTPPEQLVRDAVNAVDAYRFEQNSLDQFEAHEDPESTDPDVHDVRHQLIGQMLDAQEEARVAVNDVRDAGFQDEYMLLSKVKRGALPPAALDEINKGETFVEEFTVQPPPPIEYETFDLKSNNHNPNATVPLGAPVGWRHEVKLPDGSRVSLQVPQDSNVDPDRVEAILAAAVMAKQAARYPYNIHLDAGKDYESADGSSANGWVFLQRPNTVHLQKGYLDGGEPYEHKGRVGGMMASEPMIDSRSWTVMHEIGHSQLGLDVYGTIHNGQTIEPRRRQSLISAGVLFTRHENSPLMSAYASTNEKEMHAEAFAEWVNTGGNTNNPVVREYASTFGWAGADAVPIGFFDEPLAAAAGTIDVPEPVVMVEYQEPGTGRRSGETIPISEWDGPRDPGSELGREPENLRTGDRVRPDLASRLTTHQGSRQFANPWHDELGRFAPKGTGRFHRLGPDSFNDQPGLFDDGLDPFDPEQLRESVTAWTEAMERDLGGDVLVEIEELRVIDDYTGNASVVVFRMYADDGTGRDPKLWGEAIGRMSRSLRPGRPGGNGREAEPATVAANDLKLERSWRGGGIGTVLQEGFEDWAAAHGFEQVEVSAVAIGSYAWARKGYDFRGTDGTRESMSLKLERWASEADRAGAIDAADKASDWSQRFADRPRQEWPTPWEVSEHVGKDMIGWYWQGTKPLRTMSPPLPPFETEDLVASAGREPLLDRVRAAYDDWWPNNLQAADPTNPNPNEADHAELSILVAGEAPLVASGNPVDDMEDAYLEQLTAAMENSLGFVQDRVIEQLRAKATELAVTAAAGGLPFDLSDFNVMTASEWAEAFGVEAADIIGDVVVDSATGQVLRAGLNVSESVIADLIDKHIGRLQGLGVKVKASVSRTLQTAIDKQMTLDEVVSMIQETGPIGETSARALARTELTAATNGGMLAGWRNDGIPFKVWRSLHDDRVRDAHLEADGQTVPTEQEFEVGGHRAQYPGDPRLPVELRINCRCYMERIGQAGQIIDTHITDLTRKELYQLAQELNISGRSKMRKAELFQAIDRYRTGFGDQSLEQMTRPQLIMRAKTAGITGRWRMRKAELMVRLRASAAGRTIERFLIDAGHAPPTTLKIAQRRLELDIAEALANTRYGPRPIVGAGPPSTMATADLRREVFARYDGLVDGYIPCVGCGAKLHWDTNATDEQMSLVQINPDGPWSARNVFPCCRADLPTFLEWEPDRLQAQFAVSPGIGRLFIPERLAFGVTDQQLNHWEQPLWEQMTEYLEVPLDDGEAYCVNGCGKLAVATVTINAHVDGLVCEDCAANSTIGEFANPWHDEEGKFAPKGTGKKFGPAEEVAQLGPRQKARYDAAFDGDHDAAMWETVHGRRKLDGMSRASDEQRAELVVPPAWRYVMVADNPELGSDTGLLMTGVDAAGRTQNRYTAAKTATQAGLKYQRTAELVKELPNLDSALDADAMSNPDAAVVALIRKTGMRVGSTDDTRAAKRAYGASTLEARHATVDLDAGTARLQFTGKKGVDRDVTIRDPALVAMIAQYKGDKSGSERLFDSGPDEANAYLKAHTAPKFKIKDLRTVKANTTARAAIAEMTAPTTESEFKSFRQRVGEQVSTVLGNNPGEALKSYINPAQFNVWEFDDPLVAAGAAQDEDAAMAAALAELVELPPSALSEESDEEIAAGDIDDEAEDTEDDDEAIVASATEWANPWHDERGRFAPKGTGTKHPLFDTVDAWVRAWETGDDLEHQRLAEQHLWDVDLDDVAPGLKDATIDGDVRAARAALLEETWKSIVAGRDIGDGSSLDGLSDWVMNSFGLTGGMRDGYVRPGDRHIQSDIQSVMYPATEPFQTYRGVPPEAFGGVEPTVGMEFSDKAFATSTPDLAQVEHWFGPGSTMFGDTQRILRIKAPAGVRIASTHGLPDVQPMDSGFDVLFSEVIFDANTRMRVTGVEDHFVDVEVIP